MILRGILKFFPSSKISKSKIPAIRGENPQRGLFINIRLITWGLSSYLTPTRILSLLDVRQIHRLFPPFPPFSSRLMILYLMTPVPSDNPLSSLLYPQDFFFPCFARWCVSQLVR